MKTMIISEFKAKCIAALQEVAVTGEPLVVTRHKKPIAKVVPFQVSPKKRKLGAQQGSIICHADIVKTDFSEDWEMLQ